jgi:sugar/nucleoside kinase (ribokinase family)
MEAGADTPTPLCQAGGTALYAGLAAARLGRKVGIVTAWPSRKPLPIELAAVAVAACPSHAVTTFAHRQGPQGRSLQLQDRAADLSYRDVPPSWRDAELVHLAPVAGEVPRDAASWFPNSSILLTAQGWLRAWDADGLVRPHGAALAVEELQGISIVVASEEDVEAARTAVAESWARQAAAIVPLVALTRGARGCTLYAGAASWDVEASPAAEVDATGAGDVFAAALLIRLAETGSVAESASFACCAAALSIESKGTGALPDRDAVLGALAAQRALAN